MSDDVSHKVIRTDVLCNVSDVNILILKTKNTHIPTEHFQTQHSPTDSMLQPGKFAYYPVNVSRVVGPRCVDRSINN